MGKKIMMLCFISIICCFIFIGCGTSKKTITGTWYSDKPDTIVINADNTFSSSWLGDGKYQIKDDTVSLSRTIDSSVKDFKFIKADNGDKTLCYYSGNKEEPDYVYYDNKEKVEQIKQEKFETLIKNLNGEWIGKSENIASSIAKDIVPDLVLNSDGTYNHQITYTGSDVAVMSQLNNICKSYGSGTYEIKKDGSSTDQIYIEFKELKNKVTKVNFKVNNEDGNISLYDNTSKVVYKK